MPTPPRAVSALLSAYYGDEPLGTFAQVKGDGSSRADWRFRVAPELACERASSVIAMTWPELDAHGNSLDVQARAFIDVRALLDRRGIAVPELLGVDLARRALLLEDLGDVTFEARVHALGLDAAEPLYHRAIDLLARMHESCAPPQREELSVAYRRRLDAKLLRWELDHFREWGIETLLGPLAPRAQRELDRLFDWFTGQISALPDGFVHRDYQSRNLMWPTPDRLVVLDFQDAFIGPAPYDLVALLCDSYVDLDPPRQARLLARYAQERCYSPEERAALEHGFRLIAVQRKLKDAGRFVFFDRVRGNPGYLQFYPGSLRYADQALAALEEPPARELRTLLREVLPGFPDRPIPASG